MGSWSRSGVAALPPLCPIRIIWFDLIPYDLLCFLRHLAYTLASWMEERRLTECWLSLRVHILLPPRESGAFEKSSCWAVYRFAFFRVDSRLTSSLISRSSAQICGEERYSNSGTAFRRALRDLGRR